MNLSPSKNLCGGPAFYEGYKLKPAKQKGESREDMSMPPAFSKSFYKLLAEFAEEFALTRGEFVIRAIKHYAKELRARKSPLGDALGEESIEQYGKIQSKLAKNYWATVDPEERKRRMAKAIQARWGKKKK